MSSEKATIPFCPVQQPSEKEFQNFYEYIQKLEAKYKRDYGIVKVIPPKGWRAHDQSYELLKKQMKHARMSKNDYYQIRNIIHESMHLAKFQKKVGDRSAIDQTNLDKIQAKFWKTIMYTPPIYGADLHKSLMAPVAGAWNLGDLDSLLRDAAPVLIKGVTFPYCYVGTWKSIFCWHKEDLDLCAINYLHQGKEKIWYAIQHDDESILQDQARQAFSDNYLSCKHFLRHKTTLINPYKLKQKHPNLKVSKAYQGPNEFMVVFSGTYHCGFNSGKNIAEAVNFATRDWMKVLQGVNFCECTERSVRPDYKYFVDNLQRKTSRFRNDPHLKSLKNWVIENGLYVDTSIQEENAEQEQLPKKKPKSSKKQSSSNEDDGSEFQSFKRKKIKKTSTQNQKPSKSSKKLEPKKRAKPKQKKIKSK